MTTEHTALMFEAIRKLHHAFLVQGGDAAQLVIGVDEDTFLALWELACLSLPPYLLIKPPASGEMHIHGVKVFRNTPAEGTA